MYCSKCKNYLKIGDETCPECGMPVPHPTSPDSVFKYTPPPEEEKPAAPKKPFMEGISDMLDRQIAEGKSTEKDKNDLLSLFRTLGGLNEKNQSILPDPTFLHKMHTYLEICKVISFGIICLVYSLNIYSFIEDIDALSVFAFIFMNLCLCPFFISLIGCSISQNLFSFRSGRRTRSHHLWQFAPDKLKKFQEKFYPSITFLCFYHAILSVLIAALLFDIFDPIVLAITAFCVFYSIRTWLTARDYFREYNKLISAESNKSENQE